MMLSKKDKRLLMLMVPLLLVASAYFFGFTPFMEKVYHVQNEVDALQEEYTMLLQKASQKEHYIEQTLHLEEQFKAQLQSFAEEITQEKDILWVNALQKEIGITVSQMESSLPEQNYAFLETSLPRGEEEQIQEEQPPLIGERNTLQIQLEGTYDALKQVLETAQNASGRVVLNDLYMSYQPDSRLVTASLSFNQYAIKGGGRKEEDSFESRVPVGKENIFE